MQIEFWKEFVITILSYTKVLSFRTSSEVAESFHLSNPLPLVTSTILSTSRSHQAHILLQAFTVVVATNGSNKLRLLNISSKIELRPHTRKVVEARRRDVVRRLAVDEECVPVRGDGQRRREHVRSDGLALLVGNTRGLHVGNDPVQELFENWQSRARRIGVDQDERVLGLCCVEASLGGDGEGRLGNSLCDRD